MRLWHIDLIPYLPRQQLIAQWRECCAICSNWANKGTPNHLLVNKVMDYPKIHFMLYAQRILNEMKNRNYKCRKISYNNFVKNYYMIKPKELVEMSCKFEDYYDSWHTDRYLKQCLVNLQEKYDCGGIPEAEWKVIQDKFSQYLN